jgi:alkanesulfonate monooxygenase SsuD/methylene tetrahydromethanopterin reductase-like flavin-dependent oxidoreductase (luciferase family)
LSNGFKFADLEERVTRLKETILILKAMWSEGEATFHGVCYNVSGATNCPKPHQKPHPPIWIGGKHYRILDLVAEVADGWNHWGLCKGELKERIQYLAARCKEQKRPVQSIVKSWSGVIPLLTNKADSRQEMDEVLRRLRDQSGFEITYFIGSFGSQASYENYEAFANAVRSLN